MRELDDRAVVVAIVAFGIAAIAIILGLAWLRDDVRATRAAVLERCP